MRLIMNKHTRRLGKTFVYGHFYVFAGKSCEFYSPCQLHFVGRVRPSGCPADIKNFLTMPVFFAKLLDRHENFFYITPQ